MSAAATLAQRIRNREFIVAPGVFDMLSAKVADRAGFKALYMTGSGVVASYLGVPDAGIATYTDMVARAAQIAGGTATPLIADADTGYGGIVNVRHTVKGYERAGVAAIQIEDQAFPKKCGHATGQRLVPLDEMITRIRVALDTRESRDFLIIARTDACKVAGFDEAMRRAEAFAKAGADILFVEAPGSVAQMERLGRAFDTPLLVNMVEGGATPVLPQAELERLGFRIAIFPASGVLACVAALERVYGSLKTTGSSANAGVPLQRFDEFLKLMGFPEIVALEERYEG